MSKHEDEKIPHKDVDVNMADAVSDTISETSWDEHMNMMKIYKTSSPSRRLVSKHALSDLASLHARHQFVRDDEEDAKEFSSWEVRMARKYYDHLYKEFAIADLSRFTEGKIGLRWRMEKEVICGKGQFTCGTTNCNSCKELHSYELPFQYLEDGKRKSELVKVRVCKQCAVKLFYKKVAKEKRKRMLTAPSKGGESRDKSSESDNDNDDNDNDNDNGDNVGSSNSNDGKGRKRLKAQNGEQKHLHPTSQK